MTDTKVSHWIWFCIGWGVYCGICIFLRHQLFLPGVSRVNSHSAFRLDHHYYPLSHHTTTRYTHTLHTSSQREFGSIRDLGVVCTFFRGIQVHLEGLEFIWRFQAFILDRSHFGCPPFWAEWVFCIGVFNIHWAAFKL